MDKLDPTSENLMFLLDVAEEHWFDKNPNNMIIKEILSPEANHVLLDSYIADEFGILRYENPMVRDNPVHAFNYDLINWHSDDDILNYRQKINAHYPNASISSTHYMDKGGFMQWHTNRGESPDKPRRIYVTYNSETGSFFKYVKDGSVVRYNEPIGWYTKVFNVEIELPHCIYANGPRWSLGMRF